MNTQQEALIEAKGLSFSYPGVSASGQLALDGVSFAIRSGEYLALLGANGSGKSTLLNLFTGLLDPPAGQLFFSASAGLSLSNTDSSGPSPLPAEPGPLDVARSAYRDIARRHCALVSQNPDDQIVGSVVEEDCLFGPLQRGVAPERARERVSAWLEFCGLLPLARRQVTRLSGGEKQRLALASALALDAPVLLLDETLARLNPAARSRMLDLFDRLHREEGRTLVHVTHSLEEALRADRVLLLDAGRLVFDGPRSAFLERLKANPAPFARPPALELAARLADRLPALSLCALDPAAVAAALLEEPSLRAALAGGPLRARPQSPASANLPPGATGPSAHPVPSAQNAPFAARGLCHRYASNGPDERPALCDISLDLPPAGSLALLGSSGSGKSTLLYHANAILLATEGSCASFGLDPRDKRVDTTALRRRATLAVQEAESALFERCVADDIAAGLAPLLAARSPGRGRARPDPRFLREGVRAAMASVALEPRSFWDREINSLSGGEKRKVALAATLALDGEFLILDEPTAFLDGASASTVRSLLSRIAASGKSLLLSTHDMEEAALCDEVAVLVDGKLVARGPTRRIFGDDWSPNWALARPWACEVASLLNEAAVREGRPRPFEGDAWPLNCEELAQALRVYMEEPSGALGVGSVSGTAVLPDAATSSVAVAPAAAAPAATATAAPVSTGAATAAAITAGSIPPRYRRKGEGELGALSLNSFGQYLDRPSFLRNLSVLPKILLFLIPALALMFSFNVPASLAVLLFVALFAPLAGRVRPLEILRNIRPAWPFLLFLVLFQLLWPRPNDTGTVFYSLGWFAISSTKLLNAGHLLVRVFAFIALFSLAVAVTPEQQIVRVLKALARPFRRWPLVHKSLELGILVTLRFIPLLMEEARRIHIAQYSRGLGYSGSSGPLRRIHGALTLAVPLFVRALERAERLAAAISLRL